jgi:hypothetical protein
MEYLPDPLPRIYKQPLTEWLSVYHIPSCKYGGCVCGWPMDAISMCSRVARPTAECWCFIMALQILAYRCVL